MRKVYSSPEFKEAEIKTPDCTRGDLKTWNPGITIETEVPWSIKAGALLYRCILWHEPIYAVDNDRLTIE